MSVAKTVEAGLAAEPVQNAADGGALSQTSSRPHAPDGGALSQTSSRTHAPDEELKRVDTKPNDLSKDVEKNDTPDDSGYLSGPKLYAVFASLMMGCFLFALDQSIVATAIPVFASEFRAFEQVAWVITGYFLTQMGLILFVGQLLTVFRAKWVLLTAFFFFELGSLICAVSKSMEVMILGRAIQGVGTSGLFSSVILIITVVTRVEQRAKYMSFFGFVFVISSVVGPLLGGAFTDHVTWRWCFWINLPIGGIAAALVIFLLPSRPPPETEAIRGLTTRQKLARIDYIGTVLVFGIVVCLLMALADGGNKYAWSNWRIIFEFVLGGVLIIVFAFWQLHLDERALVPKRVLKNRTEIAASVAVFMTMLAMLGGVYQLPLYYEAVKNHSPTKAGIDIIVFMITTCCGIFISGGAASATGHYKSWILAGPPIAAVGFGLLSSVDAHTSDAKLYGFQTLAGLGIGLSFQMIMLSVQAEFHDRPEYMSQAVGVVNFFQLTGAAIGIGIVNTVQSVYLNKELRAKAPDVSFQVVRQSVTAIYKEVPEEARARVIDAYVTAITKSFLPIYIAVAIAFFASIFIRNHNLKEKGGTAAMAA